jgi:hypothetical protein
MNMKLLDLCDPSMVMMEEPNGERPGGKYPVEAIKASNFSWIGARQYDDSAKILLWIWTQYHEDLERYR